MTGRGRAFVAEFVGLTNRVSATANDGHVEVLGQRLPLLEGSAASGPVMALVRPESVRLGGDQGAEGHVLAVSFLGSLSQVQIGLADGNVLAGHRTAVSDATGLTPGDAVRVSVAPSPVFAVHASTSPRRPPDGASAHRSDATARRR